jgi:cytochrome c553
VPSGVPVFFQALDAQGLAVQTMRTLTYVGRGQTQACIGCHESRETTTLPARKFPSAASRNPSRLATGPEGTWPLRYDHLVQPVLDKYCTSCHRPDGENADAARLDLTTMKSYASLLSFGGNDLARLASEHERSIAGDCPARKSKLWALLSSPQGHAGVRLDVESLQRLATWMDLYAQRQGYFSDEQEAELRRLRQQLAPLLTR